MPHQLGGLDKYLGVTAAALVVTYVLTPWIRAMASRFDMVDRPRGRHRHAHAVAKGGGLAIAIGFAAAYGLAVMAGWAVYAQALTPAWWRAYAQGAAIILIIGLMDDRFGVSPPVKLIGQLAAALVMIYHGAGVGRILEIGFGNYPFLEALLTVIWFIVIINAFNLIDGMDGLATGLASIAALGMGGALIFRGMSGDAVYFFALAAAGVAFLRYNFHPASIFLGDAGSMFLGFTLAALALQTASKGTFITSMTIPMLAMGIPIFDTILAVWRRSMRQMIPASLRQSAARGIMQADAEHVHHRLLKRGWTQRRTALMLYGASAMLALVGWLALVFRTRTVGIYLLTFVTAAYLIIRHLSRVELQATGQALIFSLHRPMQRAATYAIYITWDLMTLTFAYTVALTLVNDGMFPRFAWLENAPFWVGPTFLVFCLTGLYSRVWSRAHYLDYLLLSAAIAGGALVSLGIQSLLQAEFGIASATLFLLFTGIAHAGILGARLAIRGVFEIMGSQSADTGGTPERVLLYGGGFGCGLLIDRWSLLRHDTNASRERKVIGILDDDPNLQGRRVHGHRILGAGSDLARLVKEHAVETVIVTFRPSRQQTDGLLAQLAGQPVRLYAWVHTPELFNLADLPKDRFTEPDSSAAGTA